MRAGRLRTIMMPSRESGEFSRGNCMSILLRLRTNKKRQLDRVTGTGWLSDLRLASVPEQSENFWISRGLLEQRAPLKSSVLRRRNDSL